MDFSVIHWFLSSPHTCTEKQLGNSCCAACSAGYLRVQPPVPTGRTLIAPYRAHQAFSDTGRQQFLLSDHFF